MPVKIFVEGHLFDHGYEGAATYIRGLYGALLTSYPDEFQIVVGCQRPEHAEERFAGVPGVSFARYRWADKYRRLLFDVPRLCRETAPDFAHFQYFTPLVKNCRWIVTIHDILFDDFPEYFPDGYRRIRDILFPLSARRADVLTTVSDYSAEAMQRHWSIDRRQALVVPNGVELPDTQAAECQRPDLLARLGITGRYLVCVSRHEPRKNQKLLLEAFAALGEPDLHLLFIGSKTLHTPELEESLRKLPPEVQSRVHFAQGLSDAELAAAYVHAEAAVYPSLAEGFGLPPLESLALGTPTLCSSRTAMADFDFFGPWHFDPSSPDQLAAQLKGMLGDPKAARRAASEMRAEMARRYSWKRSADVFRAHLLQALQQAV